MTTTKKVLFILPFFYFISCSVFTTANKTKFIPGTFIDDYESEISFSEDGSYVIKEYLFYKELSQLDTLSFGKWNFEDGFLRLYSDRYFLEDLDISVVESVSGSKDSIYIKLQNENPKYMTKGDTLYPYSFAVFTHTLTESQEYGYTTECTLKRMDKLKQFSILLYPNPEVYEAEIDFNTLSAAGYKIKDVQNNTFHVKVKDFNYKKFALKILHGYYVKVVDNDTIIFDNIKYYRVKSKK